MGCCKLLCSGPPSWPFATQFSASVQTLITPVAMASWGVLPQHTSNVAQQHSSRRCVAAQLPAHPSCTARRARRGFLHICAVANGQHVRAVSAPSKEEMEATSKPKQHSGNGDVEGPIILNGQTLHSIGKSRLEMINSIGPYVEERVLPVLKPVSKCWQPYDVLPKPEDDDFLDQVQALRERTAHLPDDYWVVLTGDLITEEALPTYMAMLNTLDGVRDETAASPTPWGRWTRQWTAEENRHGDAMNKYMYLSGKINMKSVEVTIQNLIGSGMDPKTENNPLLGFIYTSFQERATKISHGATARHAKEYGDPVLATLCGSVASDEGRHEIAYQRIVEKFFELDPSGTMCAFEEMMRKNIVMPAHLMDDNEHQANTGRNLFADFSEVAQATKTYTASDYADIIDHLVKHWKLSEISGLNEEGQKAQDYLGKISGRIRRLSERADKIKAKKNPEKTPFSWIFGREVELRSM